MKTRASRPTFTVQERFSECFHSCEVSMEGIRSSMVNRKTKNQRRVTHTPPHDPNHLSAHSQHYTKTWNCVMLFYYVCGMYGTSRMETARPPSPYKEGPVFIAALKDGPVFIRASFHSAFTVKCKRAHVFSYYPPQGVSLSGSLCTVDTVCVCRLSCHAVCPWRNADGPRASDPRSRLQL